MKKPERINLSDMVQVTLTDWGADFLNVKFSDWKERFPNINIKSDYKGGDVYVCSLWDIIKDFKDSISFIHEIPFVDMIKK